MATICPHLFGCTANFAQYLNQLFVRQLRLVSHLESAVVNCLWRAMEELRNLDAVGDAESDQRINSEVGIEQLTLSWHDALFWFEQGIEVIEERRIKSQEDCIEMMIELLQFFLHHGLQK